MSHKTIRPKCEEIELFILRATLYPLWKRVRCSDIRELLIRKVSSLAPELSNGNKTDDGKPPQKRSKLLSFMGIDQSSLAQIPGYGRLWTPSLQVYMYLEHAKIDEDADPLCWWENNHKDTTSCIMTMAYLSTPASSAPVERL